MVPSRDCPPHVPCSMRLMMTWTMWRRFFETVPRYYRHLPTSSSFSVLPLPHHHYDDDERHINQKEWYLKLSMPFLLRIWRRSILLDPTLIGVHNNQRGCHYGFSPWWSWFSWMCWIESVAPHFGFNISFKACFISLAFSLPPWPISYFYIMIVVRPFKVVWPEQLIRKRNPWAPNRQRQRQQQHRHYLSHGSTFYDTWAWLFVTSYLFIHFWLWWLVLDSYWSLVWYVNN